MEEATTPESVQFGATVLSFFLLYGVWVVLLFVVLFSAVAVYIWSRRHAKRGADSATLQSEGADPSR